MNDEGHILQCDCDDCLNAGGGLALDGAGFAYAVRRGESAEKARVRALTARAAMIAREELAKRPPKPVAKGEAMPLERGAERAGDRELGFSFSELGRDFCGITGVQAAE